MEKTITMTHRLYKDEYNAEFLYQLEHGQIVGLIATDESSDKVLVIEGTLEDLQKLASLMYTDDEKKIKDVFPSFVTRHDFEVAQKDTFERLYNEMLNEMCVLVNRSCRTRYEDTKEFKVMFEAYTKFKETYWSK